MTTVKGKHIIESGWIAAGITDAISLGSKNLPAIAQFHNINPLLDGNTMESHQLQLICGLTLAEKQKGYSRTVDVTVMITIGKDLHSTRLMKWMDKRQKCFL